MIPIAKPIIGEEEIKLVNEVLLSGMLAQGPKVKELEERFSKLCGTSYAIAVNSGTAAIHTALYAAGIKEGDEVITTPFTFVATANPILMRGAKIIFADIKSDTFNIDPEEVKKKITSKTKAIIAVNLYGQIADYDELNEIAVKHNLIIIEDACQSILAEANHKKSGSFGDLGAFSLYATKNIMCGEGGIITTNNKDFAELCKRFRHHGQSEQTKYEYYDIGYNYRLTDLQAAIALAQVGKVNIFTTKRIENAKQLTNGLKNISGLVVPKIKANHKHVFHQYTIKVTDKFKLSREDLMNKLIKNEIGCAIFYPKPLHLHPHFIKLGYKLGDFPIAEQIAKQVLSLPVHPSLTQEDINKIIGVINNV